MPGLPLTQSAAEALLSQYGSEIENAIKTDFPASVEEVVASGFVNRLGFCIFFG